MFRRLLTIATAAAILTVMSACSPTVASVTGTWIGLDDMTLRLDEDGVAEMGKVPIPVLNLSGAPGTVLSDIVGTWEIDGDRIVAHFETDNGARNLAMKLTGSGESEALEVLFDDRDGWPHIWLQRSDDED